MDPAATQFVCEKRKEKKERERNILFISRVDRYLPIGKGEGSQCLGFLVCFLSDMWPRLPSFPSVTWIYKWQKTNMGFNERIDGWMDVWMDDGWMDGWMRDEWIYQHNMDNEWIIFQLTNQKLTRHFSYVWEERQRGKEKEMGNCNFDDFFYSLICRYPAPFYLSIPASP